MDLVIKNCKLLNENGEYFIGVENGIIKEISKTPIKGEKTIDIKSNIILPGFIDPHVHFRDPGLTHKEDFKSGSESAANGGFTTVIDMPNTLPKTNTYKAFKEKLAIGKKKSIVNFELQAGVNNYEEMKKIQSLKPIAYKIFMDLESDEELEQIFKDLGKLKRETDYNGLVCTHCENQEIVNKSSEKLKEKENQNAIDYSYGRPAISEDVSVKQAIELSDENNLSLHICHLSSSKSLLQAQNARKFMDISWEFTPHHLLLTNDAYDVYGTLVKTNPPLRTKEESIDIADIDENTIIGTDHAPHTLEEKTQGTWNSSPGIPNLETVVPLLLTEVNKGNIDLNLIPNILSKNAAERFQLKNKGEIAIGKDADFTVIDLKKEGKINIDSLYNKMRLTHFLNHKLTADSVMKMIQTGLSDDDERIIFWRNAFIREQYPIKTTTVIGKAITGNTLSFHHIELYRITQSKDRLHDVLWIWVEQRKSGNFIHRYIICVTQNCRYFLFLIDKTTVFHLLLDFFCKIIQPFTGNGQPGCHGMTAKSKQIIKI